MLDFKAISSIFLSISTFIILLLHKDLVSSGRMRSWWLICLISSPILSKSIKWPEKPGYYLTHSSSPVTSLSPHRPFLTLPHRPLLCSYCFLLNFVRNTLCFIAFGVDVNILRRKQETLCFLVKFNQTSEMINLNTNMFLIKRNNFYHFVDRVTNDTKTTSSSRLITFLLRL